MDQKGGQQGKFSFSVVTSGRQNICFTPNTPNPNIAPPNKLKVEFDIFSNEEDVDGKKTGEKVSELQANIRILNNRILGIRDEQKYQKEREAQFNETVKSINKRVYVWALIQVILIGLVCYWQLKHLRRFFEAKKLV
ncbi:Protein ERP1 [Zancudomyces culisetae]|uniref:Protein ERP1 n=1 Tax=Zancudomyces culisetae TaxID=1213189 RepID=A0A1R1PR30_ZANCU|nr:Protein ERP1 [Zancudomyces culisetae]|eukprot:OMH83445.1 Protein ERP1 [Zancudomyces culisetae]